MESDSEEIESDGGHWLGAEAHDEESSLQTMKKKKSRRKKQQKWKESVELSTKAPKDTKGKKKRKKSQGP